MKRFAAVIFMGMVIWALPGYAQFSDPAAAELSATTVPQAQLLQPAELAKMLNAHGSERPVMLQVGSFVMYQQAHIAGSGYAGPGSQTTGLQLLEKMAAHLAKDKLIVIYCGCCPWNHCPNIGPAYKKLHDLGFRNVKALYIAKNFGEDWVAKGYPSEKGN
ncbi:MAG TPA: rhodanese-like domain-containing protein [Terracidiphilus sp.]|jgi:hypothetical protein